MRNVLRWLPAVVALMLPVGGAAQASTAWGVTGGLNMSSFSGNDAEDAQTKTGFAVGITMSRPINAIWTFMGEGHWTAKGAKNSKSGFDATVSLSYIEVPLLFRAMAASGTAKPYFEVGPALAFKLSCELTAEGAGISVSGDCEDSGTDSGISSFDYSLVGGAGVEWKANGRPMTLGLRYTLGLAKLNADADTKNTNLQLLVGVRFR